MPSDPEATLALLVGAHGDAFDGLLSATADLTAEAWSTPTGCPGWDIHDQLAHCVGLERRMLGDDELAPHVQVPDAPHLTDEVKRYLERDVATRRGWDPERLREEARTTFARRRDGLAALRPEELAERAVGPMGPMKRSGMLRMRLFDLASHERDIRAPLGRLDGFAGAHLEVVTEQALRGWAGAWAGRGEGRVRFDLVGSGSATVDVGTGGLERSADAPADAVVALTVAELLALAGGRSDAPSLEDLAIEGDRSRVAELLADAAITP